MKKGDKVYLKNPFWFENENLGGKEGKIVCTESYILIKLTITGFPLIKCFRSEVSETRITEKKTEKILKEPDVDGYERLRDHRDKQLEANESWDSWIE